MRLPPNESSAGAEPEDPMRGALDAFSRAFYAARDARADLRRSHDERAATIALLDQQVAQASARWSAAMADLEAADARMSRTTKTQPEPGERRSPEGSTNG